MNVNEGMGVPDSKGMGVPDSKGMGVYSENASSHSFSDHHGPKAFSNLINYELSLQNPQNKEKKVHLKGEILMKKYNLKEKMMKYLLNKIK